MVNFGFSYVGFIYLIMLFTPNILWAHHKPEGYDEAVKHESKVLLFFERVGEVLVSALALIFSDTNIRPDSLWLGWLIVSFAMMVLYELYWIRYFRSKKTMADMYSSFLGFPVAGASLPVYAFLFLGIYGSNILLIAASIFLGIGHIGIHLAHRRECVEKKKLTAGKVVGKVFKYIFLLPVTIIICMVIAVIAVRNYNGVICMAELKDGIDESLYIDINGQKQYVTIRGQKKDAPVILYLHGGPGSPDSMIAYDFSRYLLDDYIFVCWDQRGCGRTFVNNNDPQNLTVSFDQALSDTDVLVDYLSDRFGQEKIIVMGHSYGSLLGSRYVYDHPDKVSAFIGLGQFINDAASLRYDYEDALVKANAAGDDTSELVKVYNEYLADPSMINSNRVSNLTGKYHDTPRSRNTIMSAVVSPYLGSDDVSWYTSMTDLDDFIMLSGDLVPLIMQVDLRVSQPRYEVPVLFISGDCDWNCSFIVMTEYAKQTGAQYELIEGCGHYVHNDDPVRFASSVKSFLSNVTGV